MCYFNNIATHEHIKENEMKNPKILEFLEKLDLPELLLELVFPLIRLMKMP